MIAAMPDRTKVSDAFEIPGGVDEYYLLAVWGPLAGRRLEPIVHGNHFWFSWASYRPQTRVYAP